MPAVPFSLLAGPWFLRQLLFPHVRKTYLVEFSCAIWHRPGCLPFLNDLVRELNLILLPFVSAQVHCRRGSTAERRKAFRGFRHLQRVDPVAEIAGWNATGC